ncbi:hypothetical protein VTN31DRAFT_5964 [Thermomyces dupontii]|uniref:uncharacterized protein n=1 Tax=Talaromyces thermophilus TaxID=28565 RepID=UPI0037425953
MYPSRLMQPCTILKATTTFLSRKSCTIHTVEKRLLPTLCSISICTGDPRRIPGQLPHARSGEVAKAFVAAVNLIRHSVMRVMLSLDNEVRDKTEVLIPWGLGCQLGNLSVVRYCS